MTGEEIKQHLQQWGITPFSVVHYGKPVVKLDFDKNSSLNLLVKQNGGKWSKTLNGWYVPRQKSLLIKLVKEIAAAKGEDLERIDLKEALRMLNLKSYSDNTISLYKNALSKFFDYIYPELPQRLTKRNIEDYLLWLREKNYSETAIHTAINAIKFYYEQVLKSQRNFMNCKDLKSLLEIQQFFRK